MKHGCGLHLQVVGCELENAAADFSNLQSTTDNKQPATNSLGKI